MQVQNKVSTAYAGAPINIQINALNQCTRCSALGINEKGVEGGENLISENPRFYILSEGENVTHSIFPPTFSKLMWANTGLGKEFDLIGSSCVPVPKWFHSFRLGLFVVSALTNYLITFPVSNITPLLNSTSGISDWVHFTLFPTLSPYHSKKCMD